jgi:hypothetical protein
MTATASSCRDRSRIEALERDRTSACSRPPARAVGWCKCRLEQLFLAWVVRGIDVRDGEWTLPVYPNTGEARGAWNALRVVTIRDRVVFSRLR